MTLPFTIHEKKYALGAAGTAFTIISLICAPIERDLTRCFLESQRPTALPTDLQREMHLKVADATSVAYRRLLGRIAPAAA